MENRILVIAGPTASGKTALSVELAGRLHSEVISADCMSVYRRLNIGTAKPAEEERRGIVHRMIDIVDPGEPFSVSDYEQKALPAVDRLHAQGCVPVVCGGTGFYIQSLLFSRALGSVGGDASVRAEYEAIAQTQGKERLHELLREIDPESAEKLHPNDVRRVVRALEIYRLTGRKKSEQADGFVPRFPYLCVAFDHPRERLYARIDQRVDEMLERGLVEEVRELLDSGVPENAQCMQGIGYKEVVLYLKNEISFSTMRDIIQRNTRNYAKRQVTFFKKIPQILWLDPAGKNPEDFILNELWKLNC